MYTKKLVINGHSDIATAYWQFWDTVAYHSNDISSINVHLKKYNCELRRLQDADKSILPSFYLDFDSEEDCILFMLSYTN